MNARLACAGVSVRHGASYALDGVDLALRAGELVALVGPNGSGKSTLLRVLLGAQRATAGTVSLDGAPLAAISPRVRARSLTMVVDGSPSDFAIQVRDLVSLGRIPFERPLRGASREDDAAVAEAMAMTDVTHLAGRTIDTLSAGELQRAHLARAFAQKAPIMLLDEPTANLDPRHQLEALALLRGFVQRGGAAIVALHDLGLAARTCDRIFVLARGRLRADGPPRDVFSPALLADVFRIRARVMLGDEGQVDYVLAVEPLPASPTERGDQP